MHVRGWRESVSLFFRHISLIFPLHHRYPKQISARIYLKTAAQFSKDPYQVSLNTAAIFFSRTVEQQHFTREPISYVPAFSAFIRYSLQTSDSLSAILLFDHNAIVQHFVSEFPIQIMCIPSDQYPAEAGILRERFYIGHQCRSKSSVLIGCVNYDITQIALAKPTSFFSSSRYTP